ARFRAGASPAKPGWAAQVGDQPVEHVGVTRPWRRCRLRAQREPQAGKGPGRTEMGRIRPASNFGDGAPWLSSAVSVARRRSFRARAWSMRRPPRTPGSGDFLLLSYFERMAGEADLLGESALLH